MLRIKNEVIENPETKRREVVKAINSMLQHSTKLTFCQKLLSTLNRNPENQKEIQRIEAQLNTLSNTFNEKADISSLMSDVHQPLVKLQTEIKRILLATKSDLAEDTKNKMAALGREDKELNQLVHSAISSARKKSESGTSPAAYSLKAINSIKNTVSLQQQNVLTALIHNFQKEEVLDSQLGSVNLEIGNVDSTKKAAHELLQSYSDPKKLEVGKQKIENFKLPAELDKRLKVFSDLIYHLKESGAHYITTLDSNECKLKEVKNGKDIHLFRSIAFDAAYSPCYQFKTNSELELDQFQRLINSRLRNLFEALLKNESKIPNIDATILDQTLQNTQKSILNLLKGYEITLVNLKKGIEEVYDSKSQEEILRLDNNKEIIPLTKKNAIEKDLSIIPVIKALCTYTLSKPKSRNFFNKIFHRAELAESEKFNKNMEAFYRYLNKSPEQEVEKKIESKASSSSVSSTSTTEEAVVEKKEAKNRSVPDKKEVKEVKIEARSSSPSRAQDSSSSVLKFLQSAAPKIDKNEKSILESCAVIRKTLDSEKHLSSLKPKQIKLIQQKRQNDIDVLNGFKEGYHKDFKDPNTKKIIDATIEAIKVQMNVADRLILLKSPPIESLPQQSAQERIKQSMGMRRN